MLGASVVAQGWSHVLRDLPRPARDHLARADRRRRSHFDLPAFLLVAVPDPADRDRASRSRMRVNLVLVGVKLFIVLFVIFAGIGFINRDNWTPVHPAVDSRARPPRAWTQPLLQVVTGHDPSDVRRRAASSPAPPWSSSPTSASTSSPPRPRRPRTRSATCPDRHHRLARDLHDPLRARSRSSSPAWRTTSEIDPEAALATAFTARRQGRLRDADLRRRRRRSDHGGHDPHHRRHPGDLRDEPRPPAARAAWARHQPEDQHPVKLTIIIGARRRRWSPGSRRSASSRRWSTSAR